ncbi:MAG: branched-chain amino acid ABC transporter substrate-binding protein, partial [Dehalococcoidia bacterium]|nr:branched-chain amino acid ABC transporter substrate-binding protein [Dehalococcoidia bacterium]
MIRCTSRSGGRGCLPGLRAGLYRMPAGAGVDLGASLRFMVAAVVSLFLLSSCVPASAPPTFKVGLVAPFSGRDAALGYNMLVAARLALKDWNDRGGVGGSYVEILAQDDHGEAGMGTTQARKMALDPQVLAVIGHPFGDSALAASSIYREARLAVALTGPALRQEDLGGSPVFQMGPNAAELARVAARFAEARGARRLALVVEAGPGGAGASSAASLSLAELVGASAQQAGLQVPGGVMTVAPGGEDRLAQQLNDLKVDLVYFGGGYVEGASVLRKMRSPGPGTIFLGGPGLAYYDFLKLAGPAAEGACYLSTAPNPAGLEGARGFVASYRAAAGTDPWPQSLQVYDAVNAMLDALDRAARTGRNPGRQALLQGLAGSQYAGLSGPVSFDPQGNQVAAPG